MKVNTKENRIYLTDVNPFITCVLCKGYLIDATTITECLHTFCKKCIVEFLEENTNCPICDTLLHQSHPLLYISHDRTLQAIVYKLVPNLEKNELEKQIKYYKEQNQELPQQLKERLEERQSLFDENDRVKIVDELIGTQQQRHDGGNNNNNNNNNTPQSTSTSSNNQQLFKYQNQLNRTNSSSTTSSANNNNNNNNSYYTNNNDNSTYHRFDEQIALCLEPLEGLDVLERKFLICSCHITITHIKKYVAKKIYSNIEKYKDLDIVCNDEILGKDHTLKFVLVTKWKDKEMPIKLNFRPKLVF